MKRTLLPLFFVCNFAFSQVAIINSGDTWKFKDDGSNQNVAWIDPWFDDTGWSTGNAPLGYGLPDVVTNVNYGNLTDKHRTTYFRKSFSLQDTSHYYSYYILNVRRDDGVVVYVNGHEVMIDNVPLNYDYQSFAISSSSDNGDNWQSIYIDGHMIEKGTNVITAEVHQSSAASPDLFFALKLTGYFHATLNQQLLIPSFDTWKYLDNGTNQDSSYAGLAYDDAAWSTGTAEFGYGDGDETTLVGYGGNPSVKHITTYFRKTFTSSSTFDFLKLKIRRDDGIVVYLDGNEIYRDNMNVTGTIDYLTQAKNAEDDGEFWITRILKGNILSAGSHVLAAEVHQTLPTSSDLSFNLELSGLNNSSTFINRGPYLMILKSTGIQIRWQTNQAASSKVMIGTSPTNLTSIFSSGTSVTDHIINVTGLVANTKYYYSVGSISAVLEQTTDNYFITPPSIGTVKKTRILTMGDMGRGSQIQRLVTDRFQQYIQDNYIDAYIPLGDLAYKFPTDNTNGGTLKNFDYNFFQMLQHERLMKQTPIYPVVGNHEFYNYSDSQIDLTNFNRPYFNLFNMPSNGEEGGVVSGSKRYYSFNKSNIHFVVLDPHGWESYPTGNVSDTITLPHASVPPNHAYLWEDSNIQKDWLIQDLAANTQKWTIVSIHTPSYSKGSHNSDGGGLDWYIPLVRQALLPIFEQYDVDLVLSGHSHVYERSKMILGHYGLSGTFNSALYPTGHVVSNSLATYNSASTCPYIKNNGQKGIVYAVVGTGAENHGGTFHTAMPVTNHDNIGAMLIEVEGNQLDAKWITEDGTVRDQFTMLKGVNSTQDLIVQENTPLSLKASWSSGSFSWSTGGTAQEISVAPPPGQTNFTVTDAYGCVTDAFNVRVIRQGCDPSSYTINYDITPPNVLEYKTNTTIIASKQIKSGTNIKFNAGQSITLSAGFKAENGAIFKAETGGCP